MEDQTEQKTEDQAGGISTPAPEGVNPPPQDQQTKDNLNVFILQVASSEPPPVTRVPGLMNYSWPYLILSALGLGALVLLARLNPLHHDGLDHPGAGIYVISMVVMVIFCCSAVLYLLYQILQILNEQRQRLHEKELETAARNERNEIRSLSPSTNTKKSENTSSKEDKLVKLFKEMVELAATLKNEHLSEETGNKLLVVKNLPEQLQKKLEVLLLDVLDEKKNKI